ncbi:MAG: hypothetical protein WCK16_01485 [Candidatus Moraniibacteriota bacterium]
MNLEKPAQAEILPAVDLRNFRQTLVDQIDLLREEFGKKRELGIAWLKKEEQKILQTFISELLTKKESFQFVFETENGSLYFVTKDGQSLRIKKENAEFKEQPIFNKIIFLSQAEHEKYIKLKKLGLFQEYLVAFQDETFLPEAERNPYPFKKSTFSLGNYPLEIGTDSNSTKKVAFRETADQLEILGTIQADGAIKKSFASGIHNGHEITQIYFSSQNS